MERKRVRFGDGRSDVLARFPILEVSGTNRLLIENHLGILGYSLEEICVKVSYGYIRIYGNNLRFVQLNKEQVVISGCIMSVNFLGGIV